MTVVAPIIGSRNYVEHTIENAAFQLLCEELEKGIQSMKNEELYTIEEAWENIDKI